jgi:hypothetical protein
MDKPIEFCPNCKSRKELDPSLGLIIFENLDGVIEILLYHFHCASCNSYVRSTTLDHEEYIRPHELSVLSLPVYIW